MTVVGTGYCRAHFDVHRVQTVQEHLSCKRSRHPAIGKGLGLLALVATLAVISHRVGLHDLLTHLHLLQDTLRHQGAWGYLVYAALFIIATLCLIPGSLLVIAGGMLFGPLTGSLLSFAAATLASSLSFLIARWLGRDLLQRYVGHTTVFQAIERGIARSGCDFLILTRLVPLFPYNIQNYAYGLTAIRFWPFTLISAVTTLPGLVIYSVMASELAREGVTLAFALKLSLAGGLLFALVQIGKRFARARRVAACSEGCAMTQPDRRHLRRARLALAFVVAAALAAWLWFPGGRTFLQQSLTALASWILSRSEGLSPPGAAGRAGLICADDPPGDRRSAAGFPDYPGERRPVRRLLGRGAVVVQRHGRGRALLLHRQSAGARSGGETHRPRGAAQCRRLFHPLWPADDPGLPPAAVCPV